jgi:outer membrane protein assembly factor BamD
LFARLRTALALAVLVAALAGCGAAVVPQIHNDADRFNVARRLYDKGDYSIAIDILNPYVTTGSGQADIDRAIYLLGMAYLNQKEWASAETQFSRLIRDYPESDSAQSASYRLAEAYFGQAKGPDFDQDFTLKALRQWQDFATAADAHWLLPSAKEKILGCRTRLATKLYRTGDLYLKLKDYRPAKRYFQNVIDEYSDTAPYGDALIGMALAQARMGEKAKALASLADLQKQFAGKPLGDKAAQWHTRVTKWPDAGDMARRSHKPIEAPVTPVQTQQPQSFTP